MQGRKKLLLYMREDGSAEHVALFDMTLALLLQSLQVRVFLFVSSGLFCCLGFLVVVFAVWAGACFVLFVFQFGRGHA